MTCSAWQGTETIIDVRQIAPRLRRPLIFTVLDALGSGESMVIVNDHDPRPLLHHCDLAHPGTFSWEYRDRGPEVWRVRIRRS